MYVFIHITSPLLLTCVFSPGIIHGAHQSLHTSLHTSPGLTRLYSAVYYPQILRLKERCDISCLVCFARRYLVAFHNVNLSWEYLPQVPYQSLSIMGILLHDHRPNRTSTYKSDFFQSASSSSLSPSSSSLSCSLNSWIIRAPIVQDLCRFSSRFRSWTSSPLAAG